MKRITQLCLTHTLREQINPFLWWQRVFNESREVFKASCVFHSPSSISFESKISIFFPRSINDKSLFGLTQVIFVQLVWLFRLEHFDAPTHFIISSVCLLCRCLSDLISARELKRSMQSLVMAPAQTLLNNWTNTFPLQFVEHFF